MSFDVQFYEDDWVSYASAVLALELSRGFGDEAVLTAWPAEVSILLSNVDQRFSPVSAQFINTPRIGQRVRVLWNTTVLFTGFVQDIQADAGRYGERVVSVTCSDWLAQLQRRRVLLPRFDDLRTDEAVRRALAAALRTDQAWGAILFSGRPAAGESVWVNGQQYLFVDTPASAYEVARGTATDGSQAAQNLAAAINDDVAAGGYGSGTARHPLVTAEFIPGSGTPATDTLEQTASGSPVGDSNLTLALYYESNGSISYRRYLSQRFTASLTGELQTVQVYMHYLTQLVFAGSSVTHRVRVEVYTETASGLPGEKLAEQVLSRTFTHPETGLWDGWETVNFTAPAVVQAGARYWIVLRVLVPTFVGFTLSGWYSIGWNGTGGAPAPWGYARYSTPDAPYWTLIDGYGTRMKATIQEFSTSRVRLTAAAPGAWGNDLTLQVTGTAMSRSGPTLTGGTDAAEVSCETGDVVISTLARTEEPQNVLALLEQVTQTEYGRLYVDAAGTLQFRNRRYPARQPTAATAVTLDNSFQTLEFAPLTENLLNRVRIIYAPARALTSGVLARASSSITVPGRGSSQASGSARWNLFQSPTSSVGTTSVMLPYLEQNSGERLLARSVATPVPNTDYTVTDDRGGGGFDYTNTGRVHLSVAPAATGVLVTLTNSATGQLYVHNLQIRGTGELVRDQQLTVLENTQSQEAYGLYEADVQLPFEVQSADVIAQMLGLHLLSRHSVPRLRVRRIVVEAIDNPTLLTLEVGDVVRVVDDLLNLDARVIVLGIRIAYHAGDNSLPVEWLVYDTDNYTYWRLGDATYGRLSTTTRLAL
jgi:hypothetical protein